MLTLGGTGIEYRNFVDDGAGQVIRLSDDPQRLRPLRKAEAFIVKNGDIPDGFYAYVAVRENSEHLNSLPPTARIAIFPTEYGYMGGGDIMRMQPSRKAVRTLYRRAAKQNFFLLTERCNNYCLMCSQPPKKIDDSWIVNEVLSALPLIDQSTPEIGITGGEPTLLGDDLIRILLTAKNLLPSTALHILSNGRTFSNIEFAQKYASVNHPDIMVGIPIYSDLSHIHDYVVQADGAFDETIRGVLNLKKFKQQVEIRVVVHKQTYKRLPQLAEFLSRNLTFVDHVALMGLEMTGFTKANLEDLWIDPADYQEELVQAALLLKNSGMNVSIYNHQLCLLDPKLWNLARQSISDWKNEYMPECQGCSKMPNCAGFFSSAKLKYSKHIRPFLGA